MRDVVRELISYVVTGFLGALIIALQAIVKSRTSQGARLGGLEDLTATHKADIAALKSQVDLMQKHVLPAPAPPPAPVTTPDDR